MSRVHFLVFRIDREMSIWLKSQLKIKIPLLGRVITNRLARF